MVERLDGLARITLEDCNNSFCETWHSLECLFYKTKTGCQFGEKCSFAHRQVDEQPTKRSKKNDDKSAVAMLKKKHEQHHRTGTPVVCKSSNTRPLVCIFQDMVPPKSSSILRKNSKIRKPIRCVQLTKAVVRHANIRDQNPSLGLICPGEPHQRSPNAPNLRNGLKKRRTGKSDVPVWQRGSCPKMCSN